MQRILRVLPLACVVLLTGLTIGLAKEERVEIRDVPPAVLKAVKDRFPDATVTAAGKEEGDDKQLVFEIQLKQAAGKIDVTASPQGAISEIEVQVRQLDLPKPVQKVLADKYPNAKVTIAEKVILVKDGKEVLDCYEMKVAQDKRTTEVKIAPDGKIKNVEVQTETDEE
jgi:Putative beta-lactamase-inhibitor-like, PepSY-like